MNSNELRPGMAVRLDNDLYVVTRCEHVKPGKGPAYIQVKAKSIASGSILDKRLRAAEDVERVILDRRDMEYLYSDGSGHVLMDTESYEQVTVPDGLIGEFMPYIKPNSTVATLTHDGNIISVELPKVVDLEITDTTPVVKGATATNQLKEAETETGLKVRVPPFITIGETVRINTEDGSYLSRV